MTIIVTTTATDCQLSVLLAELQARGYASDTRPEQILMLNAVQRRVCGLRRWPFLEQQATINTVVGTSGYNVSALTNYAHIDAVRIARGTTEFYEPEYMAPQEFRSRQHTYIERGEPSYWTYHDDQIKLWPTPEQIYIVTVDFTQRAVDMAADTDQPSVPCAYRDVLVWGAIMELTFRERDGDGYSIAAQHYAARLAEMINEYGVRQRQNAGEVTKSGYWDSHNRYLNQEL